MKKEIIFLNCGDINHLLDSIKNEYSDYPIQIKTFNTDNPELFIKQLSQKDHRCAIITSGTIMSRIGGMTSIPVVAISSSLLDILVTMKKAGVNPSETAVIINKKFYPDFDTIIPMIRVIPYTMFIENYNELTHVVKIIKKRQITTVIGTNTVCALIEKYGFRCISIWNEKSIKESLIDAIAALDQKVSSDTPSLSASKKSSQNPFFAPARFEHILGSSAEMDSLKKFAELYAHTDSSILIMGESGTGKELFAQSIHNASQRHKMPFVPINLAAIPETLIESELFGYEGGAFSGARKTGKKGYFELAHKGTLFLDEIGDMPLPLQSRLLRVVEEEKIIRLGGENQKEIDVRIIAATNKNLPELVRNHQFREDLLYRLNVLEIYIPPLRERTEDIPAIALHFLNEIPNRASADERSYVACSESLLSYSWPGNVRELRNVIERFCTIYDGTHDIDRTLNTALNFRDSLPPSSSFTKQNCYSLEEILRKNHGNRNLTAEELGISRSTLWRRMKEENLL